MQEGQCHPTISKGEFNGWPSPFHKDLDYSNYLAESYVLARADVATHTEQPSRSQAAGQSLLLVLMAVAGASVQGVTKWTICSAWWQSNQMKGNVKDHKGVWDRWNHALLSLRQKQEVTRKKKPKPPKTKIKGDTVPFPCQAEGSNLKEWIEASLCMGWQANPLLAHLAFPDASTPIYAAWAKSRSWKLLYC